MNTPPIKQHVEPDALDPFDRRAGNREATKWVRDALNDQSGKIDKIAEDVGNISKNLEKSWQNGKPETHWEEHELFKERELERQRIEAKRIEKDAEHQKFWAKIKADVIAYSLKAAGLFIVGVVVLGTQAKFKEWVLWAVSPQPAQVEVKK